jgi:MOSC domain-containing protein YiiM
MARLLSVNVGLPRDIVWKGRTVHTAIWKNPVFGRCGVGRLNIKGDGQGDLAGHGGEQRAVFVYQIESCRYWQEQLKRTDFLHGQFGENFTIKGLPDDAVCIGDRYQIRSAVLEVTQPRVTCYRVGIRMLAFDWWGGFIRAEIHRGYYARNLVKPSAGKARRQREM